MTYKKQSKAQVQDIVVSKVMEAIKASKRLPWQKPWSAMGVRNIVSNRGYRGINAILLSFFGTDDNYLSFKQAKEHGGHVKAGAKGFPIFYYTLLDKKDTNGKVEVDATGKAKKIPLLRYYTVFALKDCEANDNDADKKLWAKLLEKAAKGIKKLEFDPHEMGEKIIATCDAPITYGGSRACYSPSMHTIQLPKIETFKSTPLYYGTCFHEIGHSMAKATGKDIANGFGSEPYAKEELVAELYSNFCLTFAGIDSSEAFDNSVSYLENWMQRIADEPKLIIQAASQAQKRFDITLERLGMAPEKEESEEESAS